MRNVLRRFETVARRAFQFDDSDIAASTESHPFERRDIHPRLPSIVKRLFDDGHYAQSRFRGL